MHTLYSHLLDKSLLISFRMFLTYYTWRPSAVEMKIAQFGNMLIAVKNLWENNSQIVSKSDLRVPRFKDQNHNNKEKDSGNGLRPLPLRLQY